MASLQDYGIRFISHGAWSDPEIEWKKSDFQTLLFNYWDVAECTEYETLDKTNDDDLFELVCQLSELTPSEYVRPKIDYEWEVRGSVYGCYDDSNFYGDYGLSPKEDFVLHNTSQALREALTYAKDVDERNADIYIYRNEHGTRTLVAAYRLQGSTLKDEMSYKK